MPKVKVKPKPKPSKPPIPCQYGCGRNAAGTLSVHFYPEAEDYDPTNRGFMVSVPTCRECLRASIRLAITIPEVKS